MGGLNNFFRKYGSSLQAQGYWKMAKLLESNPGALGKYAPIMQEAMRKGLNQFVIANYLIAKKDPEYATFLQQLMEGAN